MYHVKVKFFYPNFDAAFFLAFVRLTVFMVRIVNLSKPNSFAAFAKQGKNLLYLTSKLLLNYF